MRRLRRSCFPALLLGPVLAFAVLLPEIGHSLAHRDAAFRHHHGAVTRAALPHRDVASEDEHLAGVHPHFDLRPTPPTRSSLALFLAARTVVELIVDVAEPRRARLVPQAHLVLGGRNHGPPPPSRAPPLS